MAKAAEVYASYLSKYIESLLKTKIFVFIDCKFIYFIIKYFLKVDKKYKPEQRDAIHKLLENINDLAEIFLVCLKHTSEQVKKVKL